MALFSSRKKKPTPQAPPKKPQEPRDLQTILDERDELLARVPRGTVQPSEESEPRGIVRAFRRSFGQQPRRQSPQVTSSELAQRAAMAHPALYSATRRTGRAAQTCPWGLFTLSDDADENQRQRIIDFLTTPNDQETWPQIIFRTTINIPVTGRAYWEVQYDSMGQPISFYLIDGVVIENRDKHGQWLSPALIQRLGSEKVTYELGEFIPFRMSSPSGLLSESYITPLVDVITTDLEAMKWNREFMKNPATPALLAIFAAGLSDEEFRRNIQEIESANEGGDRAGKTFVAVSGDMKAEKIPWVERDYQFRKGREQHLEFIASVTGVPKEMIKGGPVDPQTRRDFQENALMPILGIIQASINQFLQLIDFDGGWIFRWLPKPISDDRANSRKSDVGAKHGFITLNEARRFLDPELPDVIGGEELIVPVAIQRALIGQGETDGLPEGVEATGEPVDVPHQHTSAFPEGELCDEDGEPNGEVTGEPHEHTEEDPCGILPDGTPHSDPHVHNDDFPCGEKCELVEEEMAGHLTPKPTKKKKKKDDSKGLSGHRRRKKEKSKMSQVHNDLLGEDVQQTLAQVQSKLTETSEELIKRLLKNPSIGLESAKVDVALIPDNLANTIFVGLLRHSWIKGSKYASECLNTDAALRVPNDDWDQIKALGSETGCRMMRIIKLETFVPDLEYVLDYGGGQAEIVSSIRDGLASFDLETVVKAVAEAGFVMGQQWSLRKDRMEKIEKKGQPVNSQ